MSTLWHHASNEYFPQGLHQNGHDIRKICFALFQTRSEKTNFSWRQLIEFKSSTFEGTRPALLVDRFPDEIGQNDDFTDWSPLFFSKFQVISSIPSGEKVKSANNGEVASTKTQLLEVVCACPAFHSSGDSSKDDWRRCRSLSPHIYRLRRIMLFFRVFSHIFRRVLYWCIILIRTQRWEYIHN